jgi:hypothetical protein
VAGVQSSLASGLPASPEFLTVTGKGTEKKQRKDEDDSGDEEERDSRSSGVKAVPVCSDAIFFIFPDLLPDSHISEQVCKFPAGVHPG